MTNRKTILNGKPYFNGLSDLKPPRRFSPGELLNCHRKTYYKHLNAPEENADHRGRFYTGYPRENVVEYSEAHPEAQLTPSLAHRFPELAEQHDMFDWQCSECDAEYSWDEISWNGNDTSKCPSCNATGETGCLRGTAPAEQHHIEVVDHPEGEYT